MQKVRRRNFFADVYFKRKVCDASFNANNIIIIDGLFFTCIIDAL